MIVAKDILGTINTHVISGLFKNKKIQTTKMFTLKAISKNNTSFVYHIEVKVADETFFVEMRKHKLCMILVDSDANLPTVSRNIPTIPRTTAWVYACLFSHSRAKPGHYM